MRFNSGGADAAAFGAVSIRQKVFASDQSCWRSWGLPLPARRTTTVRSMISRSLFQQIADVVPMSGALPLVRRCGTAPVMEANTGDLRRACRWRLRGWSSRPSGAHIACHMAYVAVVVRLILLVRRTDGYRSPHDVRMAVHRGNVSVVVSRAPGLTRKG
jgi:hypothetical protein